MCAIKRVALQFIFLSPALAFAASGVPVQSERDMYEECSAFSQVGMRDCLAKKAASSQRVLKQVEKKVANTLSKWDEDDKYINQAKAKLTTSNKEFIGYRKAQCEFSASLSGGGAGDAHEMGRLACVAELNNRRAEQLRDALSDMPLK